jgi:HNH endonuclease
MKIENPTEPIEDYLYLDKGLLHWKQCRYKNKIGKPVANTYCGGYLKVKVCGRSLSQHRVIWYLAKGYWPTTLDHIDGNPSNNSIENLREVTDKQNRANSRVSLGKMYSNYKGVSKCRGRWKAVCAGINLGNFSSQEQAAKAYNIKALEVWGVEYAKLNNLEHFEDE